MANSSGRTPVPQGAPPARTDTGRTYDQSRKVADPGGAQQGRENPQSPFVDPNPGSRILNDQWQRGSGNK
jgi:hypothetical protein